jgi:hypothetical protein
VINGELHSLKDLGSDSSCTSCISLDKSLNLSEPYFPYMEIEE